MKKYLILSCIYLATIEHRLLCQTNLISTISQSKYFERTIRFNGSDCSFKEFNVTEKYSLWKGMRFGWIKFPINMIQMEVNELLSDLTPSNFRKQALENDLLIINGGFYDNKRSQGLVISKNVLKNSFEDLRQGGFLIESTKGIFIYPITAYKYLNWVKVKNAIQCLPIIIDNSENAITPTSSQKSNRIGVGLTKQNELIVIYAVDEKSEAISLFDFGNLILNSKLIGGSNIESFIGLDGGPNVEFYIPSINYHVFGNSSSAYIPNLIRFFSK